MLLSLELISKDFDKGDIDQLTYHKYYQLLKQAYKTTLSNKINRLGVNEKLIVLDGKFDITR